MGRIDVKTARFKWNGKYEERVFTGTQCDIPVIKDTVSVEIGVYAGNLSTTTSALVNAKKSILCGSPVHSEPEPDVYNQIIALLEGIEGASEEEIAAAVAKYIAENPIKEKDPTVPAWAKTETKPTYTANEVGAIAESELQTAINTALAQAKASGEFDGADGNPGTDGAPGADGKSAYAYAVEGGYSGTEAEFAAKLAAECPAALPNPYTLTFTGAVTGSYDGSEAVTVNIPSGGGSSGGSGKAKTQKLIDITFTEPTASLTVTLEHNFHKLFLVWSSSDTARLVDADGNAVSGNLGILLDTTSYTWNDRKIGQLGTDKTTWKTNADLIEYTEDLSTLLTSRSFAILTGTAGTISNQFGGAGAMIGTLAGSALAPTVGRTVNIVTSGGFFAATTRIILVGEYYE